MKENGRHNKTWKLIKKKIFRMAKAGMELSLTCNFLTLMFLFLFCQGLAQNKIKDKGYYTCEVWRKGH